MLNARSVTSNAVESEESGCCLVPLFLVTQQPQKIQDFHHGTIVGAGSPTPGGVAMMTYLVLYTMIFNGGQGPCVWPGGEGRRAFFKILAFPIMFLKFSMCFPQHVPNSTTLLSHMFLPKVVLFSSM
jgi:hypothetical protein